MARSKLIISLVLSALACASGVSNASTTAYTSVEDACRDYPGALEWHILSIQNPEKAAEMIRMVPPLVLVNYRQNGFKLEDPVGDFAALYASAQVPKKIWYTLRGQTKKLQEGWQQIRQANRCAYSVFAMNDDLPPPVHESSNWQPSAREIDQILDLGFLSDDEKVKAAQDLVDGKLYLEGHGNPLDVKAFVKMLVQVINEERRSGIEPSYGQIHRWSAETVTRFGKQFRAYLRFSKLLISLARGMSAYYLTTGQERPLYEWVRSQPLNSIYPEAIFRTSYRLNQGNIYLSLLTIENLLSQYWMEGNRERLEVPRRLANIGNYLGNGFNHFGQWYHLWGMILYGYVYGGIDARFVAYTETFGSHILNGFRDEKQEDYINWDGAVIGGKLKKVIQKNRTPEFADAPESLRPEHYLRLEEDFSERLERKYGLPCRVDPRAALIEKIGGNLNCGK